MLQTPATTGPNDPITAPPASLSYNGFYKKCAYFHGLPIMGSEKVRDQAFRAIIVTFGKMLSHMPEEWIDRLAKAGSHYSIIGETEGQTDLPEYWDMKNDPKTDWNKRARGLGGLTTSGGEENILELPSDRYNGESIYIHEFGHTLAQVVFSHFIPDFNKTLRAAFDKARAEGHWRNTYSATNTYEYWAEGVQMYFDCARSATPANGVHNEVCNRAQLEKYDPGLYALVDKAFGHNPWRYEGKYCTTVKSTEAEKRSKIVYRVSPAEDKASIDVEMRFQATDPDVELELPSWSPGLYVLENYWKTMGPVQAWDDRGNPLEVTHPRDDTWMVATKGARRIKVHYARPIPRGTERMGMFASDADAIHFTGPATYLYLNGRKTEPCELDLDLPAGWQAAVGLNPSGKSSYLARSYDELADCPVTIGKFRTEKYVAGGKEHELAIRGDARDTIDAAKARDMCQFLTAAEGSFFGGLPYDRYVWQVWAGAAKDGAGGVEHASSTDIFLASGEGPSALGGMAHEFFHLWNVKRIRSSVLGPFDYGHMPKTGALWWLEGVTDYYASLLPYRYGRFDKPYLLKEAFQNIRSVRNNPARMEVSPYDSSYRVGEATTGRSNGYRVDYYPTGWVLGFLFDIELRARTHGARSLDDVELALWKECRDGRPGFEEGEIRRLLVQVGGEEMGPLYDQWVAKPGDLPIEATLAKLALTLTDKTIVESESASEESRNLLHGWLQQRQIDRRFASR
jgi:predicted metalloprotease with PDZ domain